jgi:predicted transcriptional regulator
VVGRRGCAGGAGGVHLCELSAAAHDRDAAVGKERVRTRRVRCIPPVPGDVWAEARCGTFVFRRASTCGSIDRRTELGLHRANSRSVLTIGWPVVIRKRYRFRMTRTIDLPDDLAAALKEVAAAEHRSVQQTLVLAAQEYVERHKLRSRVRESGRRIIEQDQELLDRLAQ